MRNLDPQEISRQFLTVSCGTVLAASVNTKARPYASGAYIPRAPWRAASSDICRPAMAAEVRARGPALGILRIPRSLTTPLARTLGQSSACIERQDVSGLLEYLADRLGAREPLLEHGGTWDVPGLETVTFDRERRQFLGLHLDSWDGTSLEQREAARTRVCINLGSDRRSFVFVALSLRTIAEMLRDRRKDEMPLQPGELISAFFAEFPNFPVFKISLEAGEAYFADTDNIIHDGSSFDASFPTFHYHIRGHFDRLAGC